jgi:hypothetical protein
MQDSRNTTKRLLAWAAVIAALVAVFMAYTRPEFMVELANQIWLCF